jgi:hypothetical protein
VELIRRIHPLTEAYDLQTSFEIFETGRAVGFGDQ